MTGTRLRSSIARLAIVLSPGEYALVRMATAPDGRSHIEHGMIRQNRIH